MEKSKSIVMHFESKYDLLRGIDLLTHYKISIGEVYTPEFLPNVEEKLRIKQLKWGAFILRYGCFGGTLLTACIYYLLQGNIAGQFSQTNYKDSIWSLIILVLTFIFATFLFPSKVPKIRRLNANDHRYLLVVRSGSITRQQAVTDLMNDSDAVELSADIKNMITR